MQNNVGVIGFSATEIGGCAFGAEPTTLAPKAPRSSQAELHPGTSLTTTPSSEVRRFLVDWATPRKSILKNANPSDRLDPRCSHRKGASNIRKGEGEGNRRSMKLQVHPKMSREGCA